MATVRRPWTRDELLVAFGLYLRLPFGQLHARQPDVIRYSGRIDRTPSALAMKLTNLASLDDSIDRAGLRNASKADHAMWEEMQQDRLNFFDQIESAMSIAEAGSDAVVEADVVGIDVEAAVKVRRGQHAFRRAVLSAYGGRCCVTGISEPQLLVASHIRPWRDAPDSRLDPRNGLCLNALHDRAFDRGLISFDEGSRLIVSPALMDVDNEHVRLNFAELAGRKLKAPDKFAPDPAALAYHREQIFVG